MLFYILCPLAWYSQYMSKTNLAFLGSINFVFDAEHVNTECSWWRCIDGHISLFSITFPVFCSIWLSTRLPFIYHSTSGCGLPEMSKNIQLFLLLFIVILECKNMTAYHNVTKMLYTYMAKNQNKIQFFYVGMTNLYHDIILQIRLSVIISSKSGVTA